MKPPRVETGQSPASDRAFEGDFIPRVVIEGVAPEIDCGRYPIKRVPGEDVEVGADIFTDGHDKIAAVLRWRKASAPDWHEAPLSFRINDRWRGSFPVTELGRYEYTLEAWVDLFTTWQDAIAKKHAAGQSIASELLEGAEQVEATAARASEPDSFWLREQARRLGNDGVDTDTRVALALSDELTAMMRRWPDRSRSTAYGRALSVTVEPAVARTGAWYEMFPRSAATEPGKHGTLADCEARLPYVASMGFDVLYLPPIHPIGVTHRKGPNNTPQAGPDDSGSPWAIGGAAGGHDAVHPDLGTIEDFDRLVETARSLGIQVALDIAYQCSPDHPWAQEHPEWFRRRPDGTIHYAENPPKKYQDIYPLNFDSPEWRSLIDELLRVMQYWIEHGVRIFRVDNPHTKPFAFWEWAIARIQADHPDVIFLSEAFTRPKVMKNLAKRGFSQSYTYFTWRNGKHELEEYLTELTQTETAEYMRPNLFANTPDILHAYLQQGGRPAFQTRLVLAATLGATYGIYGPPFELCEGRALGNSEEYLDSEKYQVRHWDLEASHSLRPLITRVNQIRRENPALHANRRLRFVPVDNDQIIAYVKSTDDMTNVVLTVVNLDPHHFQSGWLDLPVDELEIEADQPYQVHDLVGEGRYTWRGPRNYVALEPSAIPAHVFRLRRHVRSERDFDYFA